MERVIRLLSLTTSIIIKLKRRHVNYRSDCFLRGMGNEVSSVIGRVMDRILSARRLFVDKSRMDIVLEQLAYKIYRFEVSSSFFYTSNKWMKY